MDIKYFKIFIKMNYPDFKITESDVIDLGNEFNKYLIDEFKDNKDKLDKICDIQPINAIINMNNSLYINGYNPAFVLHFRKFLKINTNKK